MPTILDGVTPADRTTSMSKSMSLGTQLHVTQAHRIKTEVKVVRNSFVKPRHGGGLWTSSYKDAASAWVDWCRNESFGSVDTDNWFLLTPNPKARIAVINSLSDLNQLLLSYPYKPYVGWEQTYPDFEKLTEDYDALHLTEAGQWETRLSLPHSLYGWDCESTLWFRWVFGEVEQVECGVARR